MGWCLHIFSSTTIRYCDGLDRISILWAVKLWMIMHTMYSFVTFSGLKNIIPIWKSTKMMLHKILVPYTSREGERVGITMLISVKVIHWANFISKWVVSLNISVAQMTNTLAKDLHKGQRIWAMKTREPTWRSVSNTDTTSKNNINNISLWAKHHHYHHIHSVNSHTKC